MTTSSNRVAARWLAARLSIHQIDGPVRDLDARELKRMGVRLPYQSLQHFTTHDYSSSTWNKLQAEAQQWAKKYESQHFPGGNAEIVGGFEFIDPDEGTPEGMSFVVNFDYSHS